MLFAIFYDLTRYFRDDVTAAAADVYIKNYWEKMDGGRHTVNCMLWNPKPEVSPKTT